MPEFRIIAAPSVQFAALRTQVTYEVLRESATGFELANCECHWLVRNDPSVLVQRGRVAKAPLPAITEGPTGRGETCWKNEWTYVGRHVVVCRLTHQGKTYDAVYPQHVVDLNAELAKGPLLPRHPADAVAHLQAVERTIAFTDELERFAATAKSKKEQAEAERERWEHERERLHYLLDGITENQLPTYPIHAEHLDHEHGVRTALRALAAKCEDGWVIVDWTNPSDPAMSGRYPSDSLFDSKAHTLREALEAWRVDNRYAPGGITYAYDVPGQASEVHGQMATDGTSFVDDLTTVLATVSAIAGIVALALAPTGASQVAAVALASAVFAGTGAAVSVYDRHARGASEVRADVLDGLTIASSVLGGIAGLATGAWKLGGRVVLPLANANVARVLYADLGVAAVQTLLVAEGEFEHFRQVASDSYLTPQERIQQLLKIVAIATASGALFYVNYRATRAQLRELDLPVAKSTSKLEERLETLQSPDGELNACVAPTTAGSTRSGEHEATAHIDEERTNRPPEPVKAPVPASTVRQRLQRVMGRKNFDERTAAVPGIRARVPELAPLSDEEIIAIRGYTSDKINDELAEGLRDYERINRALRS